MALCWEGVCSFLGLLTADMVAVQMSIACLAVCHAASNTGTQMSHRHPLVLSVPALGRSICPVMSCNLSLFLDWPARPVSSINALLLCAC